MARYTGPKCRICRQLGFSVCGSERCALLRKEARPGMHPVVRTRMSEYKKRLVEKQKLRFSYWLNEKQFRGYVRKAMSGEGVTGENLLSLLERRLDNMVYRMGFAPTKLAGRQLVVHGHIMVNGRPVNRPSYLLSEGAVVSVKEKSKELPPITEGFDRSSSRPQLPYLEVDRATMRGRLLSIPHRDEIPLDVDENLVIEYYAKYM
ncbi:MAG: 30S ribosomal protein S4 [bacterium]